MEKESEPMSSIDTSEKFSVEVEKLKVILASKDVNNAEIQSSQKKKRKILDEDEYTNQIESIIERDFFPDVAEMRFELEYQDAIEKNDFDKISRMNKKKKSPNFVAQLASPIEDLGLFMEESVRSDFVENVDSKTEEEKTTKTKDISLNKFLNKFTSEDDSSFEKLQQKSLQKHLDKLNFLNSDSNSHNNQMHEALALPSIENQLKIKCEKNSHEKSIKMITWKHSNKNTFMFDPEGAPLTQKEIDEAKSKQMIVHENTRFKANSFFNKQIIPSNPNHIRAINQGQIGIDGKDIDVKVSARINGFNFVPSTPCLRPEAIPGSPLMTWGNIEATPINLRGDATPLIPSSSHFKIPELTAKEIIGQQLADRLLSKNSQNKTRKTAQSPLIKGVKNSSLELLNSMSPAARLLATQKLGVHQFMDRSLQESYSPMLRSQSTPTPKRLISPSPFLSSSRMSNTPKSSISHPNPTKRSKASEFF
ncbi:Solute carrier family 35 member F5 [Sarcoptes scabiei]|nr:Solute carrier family 35 member F5 [Sarcoptes scabiei]